MRLSTAFSAETPQARREWHDIFKVVKWKNLQPKILYPARLFFQIQQRIKRQAKAQGIQQYHTSFTTKTNVKSLGKYKRKDQWNTIGSPEIDPCTYGAPHLYSRK